LVPEEYTTELIENRWERVVVETLLRISDSWFVVPNVVFPWNGITLEIEVVLLHPSMCIVAVEVDGWAPIIRSGAGSTSMVHNRRLRRSVKPEQCLCAAGLSPQSD
jgi:hypothetical protein